MAKMTGFGTRTFRDKDGYVIIVPPGVAFEPSDGMVEILGVRDIKIHFPLETGITAQIELFAGFTQSASYRAEPRYVMNVDGEIKEVKAVEFADGSKWPE